MTDEELAELREWARVGRRSMQREIIWRLFSAEAVGAPKYAPAISEPRVEVTEIIQADAQPRDVRTRSVPPAPDPNLVSWRDREVKTDFKGGK